ncbi:Myblike DNAbinding domain-containing protein [Actinomortierella ambigua]|nr:Myblike DNAbinding domain-containing protein [Actinomortierella ambigua]
MQLPSTSKLAFQQQLFNLLRYQSSLSSSATHTDAPPQATAEAGTDADASVTKGAKTLHNRMAYRPKVSFTPEMDAELIRMHHEGKSWAAIASVLGIPYRTCHRRYAQHLDPKSTEWTPEDTAKLDELANKGIAWSEIARELNKSSIGCQARWRATTRPSKDVNRTRHFDALQSHVLLRIVSEIGENDWKRVLREFMTHLGSNDMARVTAAQLRHQYYRLQRSFNPWTMDEETKLIQHVVEHGLEQWDKIAAEIGETHSAEECRLRWMALDMRNKKPTDKLWYRSEQSNFWRYWLHHGDNWPNIAYSMRKRTPDMCRRFFETATAHIDKSDPDKFQAEVRAMAERLSNYSTIIWSKEHSDQLYKTAEAMRLTNPMGRVTWSYTDNIMQLGIEPTQYKHHYYYLKSVHKLGGLSGTWTDSEVRQLVSAVQELGRDWTAISLRYMPHRNPKALCHKFKSVSHRGNYISEQEYFTLLETVKQEEEGQQREAVSESHGGSSSPSSSVKLSIDWERVAKALPGWTASECQQAYASSVRSILRSAQWTEEQDAKLMRTIQVVGKKDWVGVAREMRDMDSWTCRVRYAQLQSALKDSQKLENIDTKTEDGALVTPLEDHENIMAGQP